MCFFGLGFFVWTTVLIVTMVRVKVMKWRPAGGLKPVLRNFVLTFYAILAVMALALFLRIKLF